MTLTFIEAGIVFGIIAVLGIGFVIYATRPR
jgi:hypothetical protein